MATDEKSRDAFDPRKRYAGIGMQQGRVLVDDDVNEGERIRLEDGRRINLDVIGPVGTPDNGFRIAPLSPPLGGLDFTIDAGTLYLGGLRLWNPTAVTYAAQPDWLEQTAADRLTPSDGRIDLVYLEAWQQPVTAVEDAELFEPALGGPDSSTRLRTMWRVRVRPQVAGDHCAQAFQTLVAQWGSQGLGVLDGSHERVVDATLKVEYEPGAPGDLCSPAITAGYLGAENQTIRVQLVDATHFTWGFDNAAPVYRADVNDPTTVTLQTDPRDQAHWPVVNQVIEVLPWSAVLPNGEKLAGGSGHLAKVTGYLPGTREIKISPALPAGFNAAWTSRPDAAQLGNVYAFVRIWNRGDDLGSPPAIPFVPGTAVDLGSTGIKVTISGNHRVADDHWIIAARPDTPDQVVPWSLEVGRGVHGVRRWFAPLALIRWRSATERQPTFDVLHDCRPWFPPLTKIRGGCAVSVHPGGDWWRQVAAHVDAADDVHLCFAPGTYPIDRPIEIADKRSVKISGAGPGTRLVAANEAAFRFVRCDHVLVRDLDASANRVLVGQDEQDRPRITGALTFTSCGEVEIEGITASCGDALVRGAACLAINRLGGGEDRGPSAVRIRGCDLRPGDGQIGILTVDTRRVSITDNLIAVRPDARKLNVDAVLSSRVQRSALETSLVSGIGFAEQPGAFEITIGGFATWVRSDVPRRAWLEMVERRPFRGPAHQTGVRRYLRDLARRVVAGRGFLDGVGIPEIRAWFDGAIATLEPTSAQGIVVGGARADDVRITGNTVRRLVQGIHVGVSHANPTRVGAPDRAGRVVIEGNVVELSMRADMVRERHGIFVGNCDSVSVHDNRVHVTRRDVGRARPIEGIRIYGFLGSMAVVRHNHLTGFPIGVRFSALNDERDGPTSMWRVVDNMCARATRAVETGTTNHVQITGNQT